MLIFSQLFGRITRFFMKKLFIRFRAYIPTILVVGLLLIPVVTFAENTTQGSDPLKGLAQIAGVVIDILTFLALLMLKFFGELLGTEMITGSLAMRAIQPMWMWVRNLTNILFVGVLLFLAFSNLFSSLGLGGEGGNWTIKEKLPKLIIAIIAINFSLLGFKVVIDAINIGTIAILGIADHRLESNSKIGGRLIAEKTWKKVPEDRQLEIFNNSDLKSDLGEDGDVVNEGSCSDKWEDFIREDVNAACRKDYVIPAGDDPKLCNVVAKNGDDYFVCRGFTEQINDLFCQNWVKWGSANYDTEAATDDTCVFLLQPQKFGAIFEKSSEPGQNLFAAFGSTFMHLERLPALGAEIKNLGSVVTNTLFSAIMALAFIVALIAVFIAMIARLIVLWISLVFSPLLIGSSILGVDGGKGNEIVSKIVTHLIMPLKVAAAFAVGFVMMSAMIEIQGDLSGQTFVFGPALSQLGQNEYAFLWQIATIVLFWKVAFWAVEGSVAEKLIQGVQSGAEMLAGSVGKMVTIDRQMFSVGTGTEEKKFSLGSVLQAPTMIKRAQDTVATTNATNMAEAFGITQSEFARNLSNTTITSVDDAIKLGFKASSSQELLSHRKEYGQALERSSDPRVSGTLAGLWKEAAGDLKKYEESVRANRSSLGLDGRDVFFTTESNYGGSYSGGSSSTTDSKETTKESLREKVENSTVDKSSINTTNNTFNVSVSGEDTEKGMDTNDINGIRTEDMAADYAAVLIELIGKSGITQDQVDAFKKNERIMAAFRAVQGEGKTIALDGEGKVALVNETDAKEE